MLDSTDDILIKLAFHRGVLGILKQNDPFSAEIEKAISDTEELMNSFC